MQICADRREMSLERFCGRQQTHSRCRAALGQQDFGGGDGLAHVALGVIGDVYENSSYRGREIFSADKARLLKIRGRFA
jgi:hypothetical protein